MRIDYDDNANAAYIRLVEEVPEGGVHRTVACDPSEVGGMINLDFDADGLLLGIEVLGARSLLPEPLLVMPLSADAAGFDFEEALGSKPDTGQDWDDDPAE